MDDGLQLDGNTAGGLLSSIFAFESTTALVTCNGCGDRHLLAELHAYALEMGAILRCPGCDAALVRIARLDTGYGIDLRGITVLHVDTPFTADPVPDILTGPDPGPTTP